MKIVAKEKVNQTDLLQTQNGLLVQQNYHLARLSMATEKLDEFNRMLYKKETGLSPDEPVDELKVKEQQEVRAKELEAMTDMYHGDISLGGELDEG